MKQLEQINSDHVNGRFLSIPLENIRKSPSKNLWFSDLFKGYRKRSVA